MVTITSGRPGSRAEQSFSLDKQLNDPKFVEFLGKFPDADTVDMADDNEELADRFKRFERQSEVAKNLKDVLSTQIQKEVGLRLSKDDLDSVDSHLMELAINNPSELENISEQLRIFTELPGQIKTMEQSLERFGDRDALREKGRKLNEAVSTNAKGVLRAPIMHLNFFGAKAKANRQQKQERQTVLDEYNLKLKSLKTESSATLEQIRSLDEQERALTEIIDQLDGAKGQLFEDLEITQQLRDLIKPLVLQKVDQLRNDRSLKGIGKRQEYFSNLSKAEGGSYLSDQQEQYFTEETRRDVEDLMEHEFVSEVRRAELSGKPLQNLERALKPYLELQNLGPFDRDQTRTMIIDALDSFAQDASLPETKRILVRRVLIKLQTNAI